MYVLCDMQFYNINVDNSWYSMYYVQSDITCLSTGTLYNNWLMDFVRPTLQQQPTRVS